jgi:hypothetical protein
MLRRSRGDGGGQLADDFGMGTRCGEGKTNARNRFDDARAELEQPQAKGCQSALASMCAVGMASRIVSISQ